jgi:hypothetical protein
MSMNAISKKLWHYWWALIGLGVLICAVGITRQYAEDDLRQRIEKLEEKQDNLLQQNKFFITDTNIMPSCLKGQPSK